MGSFAAGAGTSYLLSSTAPVPSGTANGVLYLNGTKVPTTSSGLTFDGTNLGLGVTPSAWASGFVAMQLPNGTALWNDGSIATALSSNVVRASGGLTYIATGSATRYEQLTGQHRWFTAPSGTAGNAISFTQAMTLDASGNLGLGVTPSAWASGFVAMQLPNGTALWNDGSIATALSSNVVRASGGLTYIATGSASTYDQFSGQHRWRTAASGTAGAAITFTTAMTLDASGNLGLGVTPPAWSGYTALQVRDAALSSTGSAEAMFTANNFWNGTNWIYRQTAAATRYVMDSQFRWFTAPSGTAGNAISFTQAMTLDASGNLGIGTTSPASAIHAQRAGGAAIYLQLAQTGIASWQIGMSASSSGLAFLQSGSEKIRIKETGQLRYIPLAADPAGAENGDVYYNSGTNKLRLYAAGAWVDLN